MTFCLFVLCAIMIICGNFPLSLFALYPPSTYYVSYADKLFFLIHRQQMRLEGNLIYLEYSRNGRKLLHSNICKCIHHTHPDIPTPADDGSVISVWSVSNCFLMVYINSFLFMLLHGVQTIRQMCWTRGGWYSVDRFLFFVSQIVLLIYEAETSGLFV